MRTAEITRKTKETDISVKINIDGNGEHKIATGIGFFDHMLTAFCVHGGFDLEIDCDGDLEVDGHHTVEDIGIVLGTAFKKALENGGNLTRYGSKFIPMDEALAFCSLDISGRPFLVFNSEFKNAMVGDFDTCLAVEFFRAFAFNAGITLHIKCEYGDNDHHKIEAIFKAVAHALKEAVVPKADILSTKGVL